MLEQEMDKIKKKLADEIRRSRIKAGLTQGDLAQRMNVTQPFISKLEKGDSMPEEETLEKLAKALDLHNDYFLEVVKVEEPPGVKEIMETLKRIETKVSQKFSTNQITPLSYLGQEDKVRVSEIEFPVGAGECFTSDNVVAEHWLPASVTYGATHMLRVRGKSMEPYIFDGEILLVVPQNIIERDGQLAVVNVSNQANTVKFVFFKESSIGLGRTREESVWYPREEIRIQGIVVNKISSYNVIREMENRAKGI